MLILPDASPKSKGLLDEAIADKFRITMLVMGSGLDVIASKADVRAGAMPSTRRVVFLHDPDILGRDKPRYMQNGAVVCVLNLDDKPVVFLQEHEAHSLTQLELAFLKAQQFI